MKNPTQQTQIRKAWSRHRGLAMLVVASLFVLGTAVLPASAAPKQTYKFTTVDAPGKDLADYFQLTYINGSGLVIQQYIGTDGNFHTAALLRGRWTLIDVPGATNTGGTNPNSLGQVALTYWGSDGIPHLAIWRSGHYTHIPDPPAGYLFQGAQGINDLRQVAACVLDSQGRLLGDVMEGRRHEFFAYPGSPFTIAFMTSNSGTTVGYYSESADGDGAVGHGFIRDGKHFVSFDYPGGLATHAFSVNNKGDIVGEYWDDNQQAVLGFQLRRGHFTRFDVPGAVWVSPFCITDNRVVAGTYQATDGLSHGFIAVPVGDN